MAHALPIAKLAGLLVKTLSKPLSKRIKHEFSKSSTGTMILDQMGQMSHQITSRMTIWSAGYKVRNIQSLPPDKAIQIGSELVGESFVLLVSAGVVIYEYQRSKQKEVEKSNKQQQLAQEERTELQQQLNAMNIRIESIETSVQQLQQISLLEQQQQTVTHTTTTRKELQSSSSSSSNNDDNNTHDEATTNGTITKLLYWWRRN